MKYLKITGPILGILIALAYLSFMPRFDLRPKPRVLGTATSSAPDLTLDQITQQVQALQDNNAALQTALDRADFLLAFARNLKRGMSGDDVALLQQQLNSALQMDVSLKVTGRFFKSTEAALKIFQETYGLPVTGVFDDPTRAKLAQMSVEETPADQTDLGAAIENLVNDNSALDQLASSTATSTADALGQSAQPDLSQCPQADNAPPPVDTTAIAPPPPTTTTTSASTTSTSSAPSILLNPNSLTFSAVFGSPVPPGQTVSIKNTGTASLNWTAGYAAGKTGTWCGASASSGSLAAGASQNITVSVKPPTSTGTFTDCGIQISDPNAANNPQTISITYKVSPGACPSGSVSLNPALIYVGKTSAASVPTGFTGGSFVSSNLTVAKVSGGTITGLATGTANITGSGWTYSPNMAGSCALSGASLTVH